MSPAIAADLAIGGFVPFSTVDWPGKLVATLFLQGCPWNCAYCQNPDLRDSRAPGQVSWAEVRHTLEERIGLLDGVVFSGGEPTRHLAISDAVDQVRELGFGAALHTSGAFPQRLEALLPRLGWVGLDIKAPPLRYADITGAGVSGDRAWASLDLVVASGVDYEIRVTVDPTTLTLADVEEIVAELARHGSRPPVLQEARPDGTTPEYAAALGDTRLDDVIPPDALPGILRRVNHTSTQVSPGIREALSRHDPA